MRYGTSIGDVNDSKIWDKGDILTDPKGEEAVIQESLVSLEYLMIEYRIEWKMSGDGELVPEEAIANWSKVGEMERPHTWDP